MHRLSYCPQCAAPLVEKEIEGINRKACGSAGCDFVFWNNPTPVVAIIVEHQDTVILARNKAWPENMFSVITGFLEQGETPEEAAVREVREELGLDARIGSFVGHYSFFRMNQIILAFHVTVEHAGVRLGDELAEYRIVPIEKLKPWSFGTGPAVTDRLASRLNSGAGNIKDSEAPGCADL